MIRGHLWTLAPALAHLARPKRRSHDAPWSTVVRGHRGDVTLTGVLRDRPGDGLVVLVHGLGGSVDSHYLVSLASALDDAGIAHLRVNLRGADRAAPDFYHAGLGDDLDAVFASPEVARRSRVALCGFSLGGHVSLRWASLSPASNLVGVAAVCPPLELDPGATALDHRSRRPYLRYVLGGLVEIHRAVAERASVPVSPSDAARIRSIREWDERIVAPWHGFRGASHYYAEVSAGRVLPKLATPALVVVGEDDPMIPVDIVTPSLARASSAVRAHVVRGGHVGFPADASLGERGARGIFPQLASWLAARLS